MLRISDDSSAIVTGCTMTSNIATREGGVIDARGYSTITATNCTMTANSASLGGALRLGGGSTLTATECTMSSNSAVSGGTVYTGEHKACFNTSTCEQTALLILTGCDLTLNHANEQVFQISIQSAHSCVIAGRPNSIRPNVTHNRCGRAAQCTSKVLWKRIHRVLRSSSVVGFWGTPLD